MSLLRLYRRKALQICPDSTRTNRRAACLKLSDERVYRDVNEQRSAKHASQIIGAGEPEKYCGENEHSDARNKEIIEGATAVADYAGSLLSLFSTPIRRAQDGNGTREHRQVPGLTTILLPIHPRTAAFTDYTAILWYDARSGGDGTREGLVPACGCVAL